VEKAETEGSVPPADAAPEAEEEGCPTNLLPEATETSKKKTPSFFLPPPKLPPAEEGAKEDVDEMVEKSVAEMLKKPDEAGEASTEKSSAGQSIPPDIQVVHGEEIESAEIDALELEQAGADLASREAEAATAQPERNEDEIDPELAARNAANREAAKAYGGHIPEDMFNVPRADGKLSVPPPDDKASTLSQLEGSMGVRLSALADRLDEKQTGLLKRVMLEGYWPETEQDTRYVIITVMEELDRTFKVRDQWTRQSLAGLIKTFLEELTRRGGNLKATADELRKHPPPLPSATLASSKTK